MANFELQSTVSLQDAAPIAPGRATDDPPGSRATGAYDAANGGSTGWLRIIGCFLVFINTGGVAASFGSYQSFYETDKLQQYSASTISWIGTTQVFLWGFGGIVTGPLYDRGYVKALLCAGAFLSIFGQCMLSIANTYYAIFLSQGICMGLGCGMAYVPAVTVVANTFTTRRPIAIGITATGSAVGGVILPIMFRELEPAVGFGWTNRILALLFFVTWAAAFFLLRPDPNHTPRIGSFFDASALTEPSYILLCLGLFFIELGYWIPPFMVTPYAQRTLHTSADLAFYFLAIMNAGGFAGRILPAIISQVKLVGPAWILGGGSLALGCTVFAWVGVKNVAGLIAWAVFAGFLQGIPVSFPNAVMPRLSPSASVVGARTGMMWMFVSLATLVGAPLGGLLIDAEAGDYSRGQIFSAVSICAGSLMLVIPALQIAKKRNE